MYTICNKSAVSAADRFCAYLGTYATWTCYSYVYSHELIDRYTHSHLFVWQVRQNVYGVIFNHRTRWAFSTQNCVERLPVISTFELLDSWPKHPCLIFSFLELFSLTNCKHEVLFPFFTQTPWGIQTFALKCNWTKIIPWDHNKEFSCVAAFRR